MARIATALWIVWAIVVWNVVFDHVIVVAGREYLTAATAGARGGTYVRMDDWMRPAIARGLWIATATAAMILLVGFGAIRRATNAQARGAGHYSRSGTGPGTAGPHDQETGPHDQTVQREGVA